MNQPSQEELLGYVLGALEAQEHRDLQRTIDEDPELEEELLAIKASLVPLDLLAISGPRPGLARRTCEAVAGIDPTSPDVARRLAFLESDSTDTDDSRWSDSPDRQDAPLPDHAVAGMDPTGSIGAGGSATTPSNHEGVTRVADPASRFRVRDRQLFRPTSWSMTDMLVGVACLGVLASLLLPAVSWSRYHSRLMACQNNLRQVGTAFKLYSSLNGGQFVSIPASGNLATAGCFGPILKDAGLIEDDGWLACAGLARELPVFIPSTAQVEAATDRAELNHYRQTMSGDFGHTMGYREGGHYVPPRDGGQSYFVLVADQPSSDLPGRVSSNHGGRGQNCLFADGHVQFINGAAFGSDPIFENDYGVIAPGSSEFDNVIAPSHLSPAVGFQQSPMAY